MAGQEIEHHPVAGGELTDQRICRARGQLTGLTHPLKTALHRDHIALGVETSAAGTAGHLQKLTGHQGPMAPFGAFGERRDHRAAGRHVDAGGQGSVANTTFTNPCWNSSSMSSFHAGRTPA